MNDQLSLLFIGGHPKDVILYAGGTMALHVQRGDRVVALSPTYGLTHHQKAVAAFNRGEELDLDLLKTERLKELTASCFELGVTDVRCLDYDDSVPIIDREVILQIADVIGQIRPDVIVMHHPHDSVGMHGAVAQMTLTAMENASTVLQGKHKPHTPRQVFFHTQFGRTNLLEHDVPRIPSVVIDITPTVVKKAKAMNHFVSQDYGEDSPLQRKLGEILDGNIFGLHKRVAYAEHYAPFNSSVYDSLPLSDYELRLSTRTPEETLLDMTQMLLDDFDPKD